MLLSTSPEYLQMVQIKKEIIHDILTISDVNLLIITEILDVYYVIIQQIYFYFSEKYYIYIYIYIYIM